MKYRGHIKEPHDLVNKEYVDGKVKPLALRGNTYHKPIRTGTGELPIDNEVLTDFVNMTETLGVPTLEFDSVVSDMITDYARRGPEHLPVTLKGIEGDTENLITLGGVSGQELDYTNLHKMIKVLAQRIIPISGSLDHISSKGTHGNQYAVIGVGYNDVDRGKVNEDTGSFPHIIDKIIGDTDVLLLNARGTVANGTFRFTTFVARGVTNITVDCQSVTFNISVVEEISGPDVIIIKAIPNDELVVRDVPTVEFIIENLTWRVV